MRNLLGLVLQEACSEVSFGSRIHNTNIRYVSLLLFASSSLIRSSISFVSFPFRQLKMKSAWFSISLQRRAPIVKYVAAPINFVYATCIELRIHLQ